MNLDELLRILTPTLLTLLVGSLALIGRWLAKKYQSLNEVLLEVRQDGRETKEHLLRLNGTVSDQSKDMKEHFEQDVGQFSEINKLLYTQQGRLDERMGEKTP